MRKESQTMYCIVIFFALMSVILNCQAGLSKWSRVQYPARIPPAQQCSSNSQPLSTSINNFGVSLTTALNEPGNLFISPLNIYTALAMTYLESRGRTARQMEQAFQLAASGLANTDLHESFRNLLNSLKNGSDQYSLLMANSIFLQRNYSVNQQYVNDIQQYYQALVKTVDFLTDGIAAKGEINRFVSEATRGKIDPLLQEPLVPSTVLALLNAIYFKGTWQIQFPQGNARAGIFQKNDGSTKLAKFMTLVNENFRFFDDPETDYKFLNLPYKGGHISMLLALPNANDRTPKLNMTSEMLCRISGSLTNLKMAIVTIPKFQLKYRKELVNALRVLGIQDLFDGSADLSGIRKQRDLRVSTILHEAVIDVNEEGSEAAAATGGFRTPVSVSFHMFRFVADHPFLFYIIDNRTGVVLFSGRLSDP